MSGEKSFDGAEALSKISGIPKSEVMKIWEEVKANQLTLDSCEGPHEFLKDTSIRANRYKCTKCGGWASAEGAGWYNKGLQHGRDGK